MPAQMIIQALETLIDLHKELNQVAREKTDVIKAEDIKRLSSLLVQEKRLVGEIERQDQARKVYVQTFLLDNKIFNETASLSVCIEHASEDEQEVLIQLQSDLMNELNRLKEQNELNQQLIYQSLQFVSMNLSLLLPEDATYTYDRPQDAEGNRRQSQSLFDSKA